MTYTETQFRHNFPDGVQHHYWNVCRNRVIHRALGRGFRGRVLDIGAGRGIVIDHLRERGIDAWGCELGSAIPISDSITDYLAANRDAFELEAAFRDSFDTVMLLDVLEHLQHPEAMLRQCRMSFPNLKKIVITLPARSELWTNYDDYFGHVCRYDEQSAAGLVEEAGLRVHSLAYFFRGLYLPIRLVAAANRERVVNVRAPDSWLSRSVHGVLGRLLDLEARWVPARIPGSSLLALATP